MGVRKDYAAKGMLILFFAVLAGMAHGYYVSAIDPFNFFLKGDVLCNGVHVSDFVKVDDVGLNVLVANKVLIKRGSIALSLYNPAGELVYFREDDKSIFRQYSAQAKESEDLGLWKFELVCDRAEIVYDLSVVVEKEEI